MGLIVSFHNQFPEIKPQKLCDVQTLLTIVWVKLNKVVKLLQEITTLLDALQVQIRLAGGGIFGGRAKVKHAPVKKQNKNAFGGFDPSTCRFTRQTVIGRDRN